jgi:hypothetical protein
LLLWAAIRARSRRGLIGWSLAIAVILLVGGQALAVVSGLASGETEPVGLWWALVTISIAGYTFFIAVIGLAGLLLLKGKFGTRI